MRVSIFGIGYVGVVSAACLARDGFEVVAVDVNRTKVELLNAGQAPIVEPQLEEMIEAAVRSGRLRATTDVREAVLGTELSLVCVGTPSAADGSLDLRYVREVCEQIGTTLAEKGDFHAVVMRSTMLPGSMNETVIPTLEKASGKAAGEGFGIGLNPEFLREGTAIYDYYNPPMIVVGAKDETTVERIRTIFAGLDAPWRITDVATAEAVKYTCNAWHAAKISFANEIGNLCKAFGVDGHEVMDIVCTDRKLNVSAAYMKPGFAFGGSCLPKDVRALRSKGVDVNVKTPMLDAVMEANDVQIDRAFHLVQQSKAKRIGILGLSFKEDTDDLRESPLIELAERLMGKGYDVKIYDANVVKARNHGPQAEYINNTIGHISARLTDDFDAVIEHGEVLLLGNKDKKFLEIEAHTRPDQKLIDLMRCLPNRRTDARYEGMCW